MIFNSMPLFVPFQVYLSFSLLTMFLVFWYYLSILKQFIIQNATYFFIIPKYNIPKFQIGHLIVPDRATRNSNFQRVLTLKTQTQLNSILKKPEKFVFLESKLQILEQKSSLIHVQTRQFETRWNSNSIKSELDLALLNSSFSDF